jgi:hypothetical protein
MGAYHSANILTQDVPIKSLKKESDVREILDALLNDPQLSVAKAGKMFRISGSTLQTWMVAPEHLKLNATLIDWLAEGNHLERWLKERPRNSLSARVVYAVNDYKPGQEAPPTLEPEPEPERNVERLIGPSGIGTFVPGTTDDLLVVKEEALRIKAEAEAVAIEATVLATAIDTVRDWLTDKDRLQQALGRIQNLESQLKESDTILKRFQQQKLASNQVHSRD